MVRARFAAPALLVALTLVTVSCSSGGTSSSSSSSSAVTSTINTSTATGGTSTEATTATSTNQVISVAVSGGRVKPAPDAVAVKLGSTITIQATADVADEVHVHGYDKHLDLEPNQLGSLDLTANIPGEFEVELEDAHLLLFTLRVS